MTHLDDVRLQDLAAGAAPERDEDAHLSACAACRAEVDAYRALCEVLGSLRPAGPPAGFAGAVMERIEARRRAGRRDLALALAVPLAGIAAIGFAARAQIAESVAEGAASLAVGAAAASRAARFAAPILAAFGPALAVAAVVASVAALAILRRLVQAPVARPRAGGVAVSALCALLSPAMAGATEARSPRLLGDWPAEERRVTLDLEDAGPAEAMGRLGEAAGWSVVVAAVGGGPVTLHLRDVPADQALAGLLEAWDMQAHRVGGLVTVLAAPAPAPVPATAAPPPVAVPVPPKVGAVDRTAMGSDVVVREGESVRDVAATGGDVVVRGTVLGDVAVMGGDVRVARTGHVHGDVSVAGGEIDVDDGGRVDGARSAIGSSDATRAVLGWAAGGRNERHRAGFFSNLMGSLAQGAAFFVLALLLSVFAKDRINLVTEEIRKRPVESLGRGLVGVLAVPVVTVLLVITVIGILVVPFLWIAALLATFAGMVSIALLVGEHLPIAEAKKTQIVCLAIGAAVFTALDVVPFGSMALGGAGLVAFGAVLRTRFAKPNGKPPAREEFAYR
jgi:hypothetical protein